MEQPNYYNFLSKELDVLKGIYKEQLYICLIAPIIFNYLADPVMPEATLKALCDSSNQ